MYPESNMSQMYKVSDDEIQFSAISFENSHNQHEFVSRTKIVYKIIRKMDNQNIGQCTLLFDSNLYCFGNVSLNILPQYNGNDYEYKIFKLLGQVALNFDVKKLNINTLPDDIKDIELFERLGARFLEIVKIPRKTKLKLTKKTLNNLKKQKFKKLVMYEWKIEGER